MKKLLYFIMLLTLPAIVFAESETGPMLRVALFVQLFCSPHMVAFVLWPLAKLICKDETKVKSTVVKLFILRVIILIIMDLTNPFLFYIEFIVLVIGAFTVFPIMLSKNSGRMTKGAGTVSRITGIPAAQNAKEELEKRVGLTFAKSSDYDNMYLMSESDMLDTYIEKELEKNGYNKKSIPFEMVKRRKTLDLIFVFLLFTYVVMIFFHFPLLTYIIGLLILIVYLRASRRFNIVKFINKEITSRPSDNMKNIIASVMSNCTEVNNRSMLFIGSLVAIILPMIIFINPVILYEKADDGYYVRYYAWGLKDFKTVTIPETHNGEPVTGLRGNTFSNMYFLESVNLPNTIKVMRGQTFKNDNKIKSVTLPSNLEYLGGGAFYNCTSLEGIVIPDSVTEIGGEAFTNCISLKEVILPKNLTEIRGNTFEECVSLTSIEIPSSVTRIGGHAFYGCSNLSTVMISEDSRLNEIGSSAFRKCYSLYSIILPSGVSINERAFKESPTNISYFGENKLYNKNTKLDFKLGESQNVLINNYKENITIKFNNYVKYSDSAYRFDFIVSGAIDRTFSLSTDVKPRYTIDDVIEFDIDYYSENYIILNVHYN